MLTRLGWVEMSYVMSCSSFDMGEVLAWFSLEAFLLTCMQISVISEDENANDLSLFDIIYATML